MPVAGTGREPSGKEITESNRKVGARVRWGTAHGEAGAGRPPAIAWLALGLVLLFPGAARAEAPDDDAIVPGVRVGVLRFGTVNWELDTLRHHGLGRARGIRVEAVPLASKSALTLALQAGEIDLMVGDWLWVVGERQRGRAFSFVPYSTAVGSLVARDVPGERGDLDDLRDLRGLRVGVAGGVSDKNWILLRAWARRELREDLSQVTDQLFAPPPLLSDLLRRGELDVAVTNWNYAVRLRRDGFRVLVDVADILPQLGIEERIPLLGWVFRERWAQDNAAALEAFVQASYAAKALLAASDAEWRRLLPRLRVDDDENDDENDLTALRDGYRDGIPQRFGRAEQAAVRRALVVLVEEAGARALGLESARLPAGTFWEMPRAPWRPAPPAP